jgi:PD-(D/E)XK endonuclease
MMTTDQKGNIAETAIALQAMKLGLGVYRPVMEGERYDLILDTGSRLLRTQCKWASRQGDVIVIRCYSARRGPGGKLLSRRYSTVEADAFAAYSFDLDRCFLLPPNLWADRRELRLRISPTRNNQIRGVHWAKDYEFAATMAAFGAVAQLGERLAGSQKVTGSSPVGSTECLAAVGGLDETSAGPRARFR